MQKCTTSGIIERHIEVNTWKWDRKRGSVGLNRLSRFTLREDRVDKNIWFVTRNKRKMWFGDSSTLLSFPLASRMMDELTNSPKIQVRLAEYWVVFPTRTTEEECATKDKFGRIFSLWVFVWIHFSTPKKVHGKYDVTLRVVETLFKCYDGEFFSQRSQPGFPGNSHVIAISPSRLKSDSTTTTTLLLNNPGSKAVELG